MDYKKEKNMLLVLFFASGISGLIYEVVFMRILSRVFGITAYSTSITLAAFMAGLAIGSYIFGKIGDKSKNLLKVYMTLQLLTGISAAVTPYIFTAAIPLYKWFFVASGESRVAVDVSRIILSFITLLIPTTLMGGTLPVLVSHMTRKDKMFGNNLSIMYSINTLGAMAGVLLSGFFTIELLGEWETILIGVMINFMVSEGVLMLNRRLKNTFQEKSETSEQQKEEPISPYSGHVRMAVLIAMFISGFSALAYEVIWTRQLILYLYVSIYAFSAMLAVFLAGIASGSFVMNKMINRIKLPLNNFGLLEGAVGVLTLAAVYLFPHLDGGLLPRIISPILLVFPVSFMFGMIFPLATVCFAQSTGESGVSIGAVYGFNTIGNVLGALVTGFSLISLLGSLKTLLILAVVNILAGLSLLFMEPFKPAGRKAAWLAALPVIVLLAAGLINNDVFFNVISDRLKSRTRLKLKIYFYKECTEGTLLSFNRDGWAQLQINGTGQTKLCTETKIMAHLPYLLADNPRKMLIICFGMGTILKSASIYDTLDISTVELVPEVYKCFRFYHKEAGEILKRKNLHMFTEYGRNFLLLSPDKYDIISVDPSPPVYSAGTVNLYTKEFFTLCKEHLTPGGVMCLWVMDQVRYDTKLITKTFLEVFPNMAVWEGPNKYGINSTGGVYLTGKNDHIIVDVPKFKKAFQNPALVKDLQEYDMSCYTSKQMLGLLLADGNMLESVLKKIPVITDDHPYTEFRLWR